MQKYDSLKEGEYPSVPVELDGENLEDAIERFPLIVIDCWASWCAPCRMIAPVIEELAKDYQNEIVFGKLDVDDNRETAMKFRIMSIPTLLVFKDGEVVNQLVGAMPKDKLETELKKYL